MDGVSLCKIDHSDDPSPGKGALRSGVNKARTGNRDVDSQRMFVSTPQ
jgi:hypothetical protein